MAFYMFGEKEKKELRRALTGAKHKNHRKRLHINKTKLNRVTGQNAAESEIQGYNFVRRKGHIFIVLNPILSPKFIFGLLLMET